MLSNNTASLLVKTIGFSKHISTRCGGVMTYSTGNTAAKEIKVKTFQFAQLGLNNHVLFKKPEVLANTNVGETIIVKHNVESKPFVPQTLPLRVSVAIDLTKAQIEEINKLRPTMSQKQLAEKFGTTKQVIARVSRQTPEQRQHLIDTFQIPTPKVKESLETKKARLNEWTERMQQREYEEKVLSKARGYEDEKYYRRVKQEIAYMAAQQTYDAMVSGQELLRPDQLEALQGEEEEKAKKQEKKQLVKKQLGRRRKHVSEKEKQRVNKAKSAKVRLLGKMEDH